MTILSLPSIRTITIRTLKLALINYSGRKIPVVFKIWVIRVNLIIMPQQVLKMEQLVHILPVIGFVITEWVILHR